MRRFLCSAPLVGAGTVPCLTSLLLPGKSALVMEVDEGSTAPVDAAVARCGGIVYRSPLTD